MDMISWETVAISSALSALLSVVVTLGADFFARPSLDARKERILDRYRARRDFGTQLMLIQMAAGMLSIDPPADFSKQQRQLYDQQLEQARESVIAATKKQEETFPHFGLQESAKLRAVCARYTGQARGIAISDKSRLQASQELGFITGPLLDYFVARGWRRLRRRAYLRLARLRLIG